MFADEKISSWWTPERVAFALGNYVEVSQACTLEAVEAMVDIDRAIAQLTPRLRAIADRYWRRDYDQSEIAREEKASQQRVSALAQDARREITDFLCRGVV